MDFLFINTHERAALMGLPHLQQLTYLLGLRPYMDRKTFLVGIKRCVSYQSIAETLYIEPHPGIQSGSPSRQQLRRAVKGLEQAGLIALQSSDKHLVLKCLLAKSDYFVQNKADTNPTPQANTKPHTKNNVISAHYDKNTKKADKGEIAQTDTPHNSEDICVFVCKNFETFWATYPQPHNKPAAQAAFNALNPDELLFSQLMTALHAQIAHHQQQQSAGLWVPHWKYPANWLAQQGWNDPLITNTKKEFSNAKLQTNHGRQSAADLLWESCKAGADFSFDEPEPPLSGNVVAFNQGREHR